MTVFSAEGLSFAYPGNPEGRGSNALDAVDFGIEEKKITVLLGPNGSGKSTLLKLLLGYLKPKSGEVRLYGRRLASYNRGEFGRLVAFVPQFSALPYNYSVLDYILLGRAVHRPYFGEPLPSDRDAACSAAARAGIEELCGRGIQELSAGELQMVSVVRALAQEPKVLLMDEPTSHLDPAHALQVYRLMARTVAEGMTILFTSHDPLHAGQLADKAMLLKGGSLLYAGGVAEALGAEMLSRLYDVRFRVVGSGDSAFPLVSLEE